MGTNSPDTATYLAAVVLMASLCTGLELDVELDPAVQSGSRVSCAVVRCVEDNQPSSAATPSQSQSQSKTPRRNISSLTIYKSPGLGKSDAASDQLGVEVASLTTQHSRIVRVSDGIKVDGVLDASRASITLEMTKSTDCFADFVCRLRSVDVNGEDTTSVARVHQGKRRSQSASDSLKPSISLQLLDLVHQLDVKVAMAAQVTDKLESKMGTLDTKIGQLENNLNTNICRISDQMDSKLDHVKERLEDKIELGERSLRSEIQILRTRLEDRLEDIVESKLGQVHTDLVAFTESAESYSDNMRKSLNESFRAISDQLTREQEKALTGLTSVTQNMIDLRSHATDNPVSTARNLTNTQNVLQEDLIESLKHAVNEISSTSEKTSKALTLFQKDLYDSFQDLTSAVNQSAMILQSDRTVTASLKDLLSPKRCARGVMTVLSSSSYPYPLIEPDQDSIVGVPHLCDTDTDGGGWIVIQRRSRGDVDFYRGWEEYKKGFGDLSGDFYLGNENIHKITRSGPYELRITLIYRAKSRFARYGRFSVADESSNYLLTVGEHSGTLTDSLIRYNNGQPFTTLDRDNDFTNNRNCAVRCVGAWWYGGNCGWVSLNGKWQQVNYEGPFWHTFGGDKSMTYTEMKVRHLAVP